MMVIWYHFDTRWAQMIFGKMILSSPKFIRWSFARVMWDESYMKDSWQLLFHLQQFVFMLAAQDPKVWMTKDFCMCPFQSGKASGFQPEVDWNSTMYS